MKYLSVCSGMEAATVAWHPLGWTPVGFSEIEPFPSAILAHRFPNTKNYGDLTKYTGWQLTPGSIDLLVGGTPCQAFSVAGLRRGLADPRGNLALIFLGLVDKLRPKWVVWENVPGVLSSNGAKDFSAFLSALGQLGYGFAYRVLDAQHFGVPQRRRRVFVVATSTGDCRLAAEVLSLPEGLRGYLETRKQKRKSPATDAGAGAEADGLHRTVGTLCADTHPGAYSGQDAYTGRLIPDQKPIVIDRAAFNQGENAQYEPHIAESDVMDSLIARGPHAVGQPIPFRKAKRAQSTTDDESWVEGKVSNTLNNFDIGDTRTTHAVVEPIAIQGTIIGRSENAGPQGVGANQGGPMFTLTKTDIHGVATQHCSEVAPTVTSSGPPYSRTGNERVEADALVAHPIISPTVTTCKGSRGGCSSEAIDEITAIHQAQQADPKIIQVSELRLQGKITEQDVCPTLKANTKSGDTEPLAFQPGNLVRKAGADPSAETFPTLTKDSGDQSPHVAYPINTLTLGGRPDPVNDARMTMGVGNDGDPQFTLQAAHSHAVATSMAVRRLTPIECERLQGFPDNWSQIPWKGKPAEQCPDGPRYKACGNSMAVPVMAWIGKRIQEVEAKQGLPKA